MSSTAPATAPAAPEAPAPRIGLLATLGRQGDVRQTWNPENDAEVEAARATFDRLRAEGHLAFRVEPGGGKGSQIREFDPDAAKIIMAPPMRGG